MLTNLSGNGTSGHGSLIETDTHFADGLGNLFIGLFSLVANGVAICSLPSVPDLNVSIKIGMIYLCVVNFVGMLSRTFYGSVWLLTGQNYLANWPFLGKLPGVLLIIGIYGNLAANLFVSMNRCVCIVFSPWYDLLFTKTGTAVFLFAESCAVAIPTV